MRRVSIENRAQKDKFGEGKHGYQSGNAATGVLATIPGAAVFDSFQEEISAVIEEAGIALDGTKYNQLLESIVWHISNGGSLPVAGSYNAKKFYAPGTFIYVDGNWYEAYHPDGCLGKDPRDPTNRPEAWGNTDVSQPYYWIKIGPWLELPPVGSPIYLPSTTLTEGLIKYRGDGLLHKDKFWRLATRHSSLVSGDYVKIADLRAEFLRGLDDGRGIDLNREINSTQLDAIENIKGQFQMQGFEGSIAISNTGPFYSERVGFNAAAGSYYGAYKALFDLSRSNRTANETRSRNIAMRAATRI